MSEDQKQLSVTKFTLNTGKIIYLREPEIRDTELATKAAGREAGDNMLYTGVLVQKEMAKLLLVQIDSEKLSMNKKQMLNEMFNFKEWKQVLKAVHMVTDDDDEGNDLKPEITSL